MMEYKGYFAKVDFDDEANVFHGEVINLRDVITFEGETVDELRTAFLDSVEDYLAFCKERGEEPDKPYSGKFLVRVEPELHKTLVVQARKDGKSLNTLVNDALLKAVKNSNQQVIQD
ncbi:toxin-antitoxin system, antitoxin component, ribbon-helix-helix domain protein [delta proteobacterium NaphS2]|nr:toxin-antitoxin system, antitoxin component, ribbon-helix-helix domain protein [delta proteobacterium NaphS2]